MNKRTWTIIGLILAAGLLFSGGIAYGQSRPDGWGWMNGGGMMGDRDSSYNNNDMMNSGDYGTMMGDSYGMMMGYGDMMGMPIGTTSAEPLTIAAASEAVTRYIATLDEDNLTLGEVMIFDNHAYAQVLKDGSGAFEVLVDHATGNVYPEPGPNMMWNTEYSPMADMDNIGMMGRGMMGSNMMDGTFDNMMDGFGSAPEVGEMISAENAVTIAQRYLDTNLPNAIAEAPDAFHGYYTLHIERDGEIDGMLSVNGYSGQVFAHHWHGDFIEMAGGDHN
jgi:hypothetical protein